MDCVLCGNPIEKYSPEFHDLQLDDGKRVSICTQCTHTFAVWQQHSYARLFPTRAAKRYA